MNIQSSVNKIWLNYVGRIHITRSRIYMVRMVCMLLAVMVSLLLAYVYAWQGVEQTVELPGGLNQENQELNSTLLQELLKSRAERVNASHTFFTSFSTAFLK